ncbi:MAG: pilus assembly protein PilP [Proteobacteria bacterium]|nr:pilus assembly protein PilP [Pseudomonadota bacterium]
MSIRLSRMVWLIAASVLVAACGRSVEHSSNDPSDLAKWAKDTRAKPGPPLQPLPPITPFETFKYDAQGLRDPFDIASAAAGISASGLHPDSARHKQPLEHYPLDALKMVGTIGGKGKGALVGLVMTPDKVTYRVGPGMYIGQSEGRVTTVTEDRIDIVELTPDGAGGWLQRPASIALNSP